ncbi:S9 family peptidase [Hamadaea tsunoensis]|uniref:S9 family peptidase n=1 Tax=Hamadaea tsunoensis TaxID=53368 RepID=UPI0012F7A569|nr:prolyl oligopeptidase family serine peptidase [Hamadaea tsunoensis]
MTSEPSDVAYSSPQGNRRLVVRTDDSGVDLWHVPHHTFRYASAGRPIPVVTMRLTDPAVEVHWDPEFPYIPAAGWDDHGPYAVVQTRDQRRLRILAIEDDGTTRILAEDTDPCWTTVVPGLPARTPSGALLWHAGRRLTVDGTPVTPDGLFVKEVTGVDGETVHFTGWSDPTALRGWSYSPGSGTALRVLAEKEREAPVLELRRERLVLGPRALRAHLFLPSWHRGERLPVLLDPYAGPSRQRVTDAFDWHDPVSQWFAEAGFAVLVTDGAGTPGRGPAWEREIHGDLLGPVLADQISALECVASMYPFLDRQRVGIRGWSFGGTLALYAVLRRPDLFHAAVAGAPITDQRTFHAYVRERHLGHPATFPDRYAAADLVALAPELRRPLLLMHGTEDTTVHPSNTERMAAALRSAGIEHEVSMIEGMGHSVIGLAGSEGVLEQQLAFLQRTCLGG